MKLSWKHEATAGTVAALEGFRKLIQSIARDLCTRWLNCNLDNLLPKMEEEEEVSSSNATNTL